MHNTGKMLHNSHILRERPLKMQGQTARISNLRKRKIFREPGGASAVKHQIAAGDDPGAYKTYCSMLFDSTAQMK